MYMIDKIDRKLLALLQEDCSLSLQALADAVNLHGYALLEAFKKARRRGDYSRPSCVVESRKVRAYPHGIYVPENFAS